MTGDHRATQVAQIESRLAILEPLTDEADPQVAAGESAKSGAFSEKIAQLQKRTADETAKLKSESDARLASLEKLAASLSANDAAGHEQLLHDVKAHNVAEKLASERPKEIRADEDA